MIFIDAGAFVARYRRSDEWHQLAVKGWAELERTGRRRFTSALVFGEAVTLLARYTGVVPAVRFGHAALASEMSILRNDEADDAATLEIMAKYADMGVGYTDCACFVQMRRQRLTTVFGFDSHFERAGFRLWPPRK